MLEWRDPYEDQSLTREEIGKELFANRGRWAIVARPDRRTRADALVERINSGREYGPEVIALCRNLSGEIRVYAMAVRP